MKIKKGDWVIDSKSLFRVKWNRFYPVFQIHEKYEKEIKWILRTLTFIGVAVSVIAMPWFFSFAIAVLLVGLNYAFENVVFHFTSIVFQSPPNFEIKNGLWISNLFLFPNYKNDLPIFCLGFTEKEYAENLFDYFLSWNNHEHTDMENNIIIKWTIKKDNSYVTEIYANPRRKNIDKIFRTIEKNKMYEKYGKKHQELVAQIVFGQRFKSSEILRKFIQKYKSGDPFYFAPALVTKNGETILEIINQKALLKTHFTLKY